MKKAYEAAAVLTVITLIICILTLILPNVAPQAASPTPTPMPTATPSPNQTPNSPSPSSSSALPSPTQTVFHGVPIYSYNIVQSYPHDSSAFTEGLLVDGDGELLESTGLNGASSLRRVNLVDGSVLQRYDLPAEFFGEGVTVVGDRVVQLTWQNHTGFVYDKATFEVLGNFSYDTEGWGLTFDGNHLIMSDGSSTLYFLDSDTFQVVSHINVHDGNGPVDNLNELEYVNGVIYANIWFSTKIAVINPVSGQIQAYIDLAGLAQPFLAGNRNAVLNGVAYDSLTGQFFVTGKFWSSLYEIKINQ
jgi:glutamine cyclotransferase